MQQRRSSRREFVRQGLLGLGAAWWAGRIGAVPDPGPRLNVLLLASEDTPRAGLGCYGNPVVRTPCLDAFARSAVRFDRAYCQAPVCNPSRTSLATGVRSDKTNVWGNADPMEQRLPAQYETLPEYFRRQGYYTCAVGKFFHHNFRANRQARAWHQIEMSPPPHDYNGLVLGRELYDSRDAPPNPSYPYRWDPDPVVEARIEQAHAAYLAARAAYPENSEEYHAARKPFQIAQMYRVGDSMEVPERSADGIKARMAAALLQRFARSAEPFFLSVQCQSPHTPFRCPRQFLDLYSLETIETSRAGRERDVGVPALARRGDRADLGPGQFYGTEQEALRAFYGCCSFMDAQFGIVLKALADTGLDRNTIVIYIGDHGFMTGQHGLWCKNVLFEEATGVPLIVRMPGAAANGQACDGIVELVDLFPTLADCLGLPLPRHTLDGETLRPWLDGAPELRNKVSAYSAIGHGDVRGYSVRREHLRYSQYRRRGQVVETELYDLSADPHEHRNRAGDPAFADLEASLAADLRARFPAMAQASPARTGGE